MGLVVVKFSLGTNAEPRADPRPKFDLDPDFEKLLISN